MALGGHFIQQFKLITQNIDTITVIAYLLQSSKTKVIEKLLDRCNDCQGVNLGPLSGMPEVAVATSSGLSSSV